MSYQNCRVNKVYYTTIYNNKLIKVEYYGDYRKYKINSGNDRNN